MAEESKSPKPDQAQTPQEISLSEEEALLVLASDCLNGIRNSGVLTAVPSLITSYDVAASISAYFRRKYKHNPHEPVLQAAARKCLAGEGA